MYLIWALLIILPNLVIFCYSAIPTELFEEFLKTYSISPIITTFFCDKHSNFRLIKQLSKNYQINALPVSKDSLYYPLAQSRMIFILDLKCPNSSQQIIAADEMRLFSFPYKWIFYHENYDNVDNIISNYFESTKDIQVDSDVALIVLTQKYNIWKIFKQHTSTRMKSEYIGSWMKTEGLILRNIDEVMSRRRKNLQGIKLHSSIVMLDNDTINHLFDKRDNHIDSVTKVSHVLVRHLADIVNISLSYSIHNTWGVKDNTSNWTGMIGELVRHEADIGDTPLFFLANRVNIIDYIAMVTPTRSNFIFRQPKLSYVANVFTLPFDNKVWICTFTLLVVVAINLYVAIRWEWMRKKYQTFKNDSNEIEMHNSWVEVAFITYSAFCQQGSPVLPFSFPGRIIIIFLFMSLMFLYTSYSANIVALLQSSSTSIQTLEDLLKSRLDFGVDDTIFNRIYFPAMTEPIRRAIYTQKIAPPGQNPKFMTIEEGIRRVRKGLFAFHVETGPGYKLIRETFEEGEKCGLKGIMFLQVIDPWLAIQKNSSYKKMFKVGNRGGICRLYQLRENGLQARELNLIYTKKPPCLSTGNAFINVGLVDCYPALVVVVGGFCIAALLLIFEIYIHNRFQSYKRQKKFEFWKHIQTAK